MENKVIMEDALFTVQTSKDEEGVWTTKFTVRNGTVNEFTFGTDEVEAQKKTAMLLDGIVQGLEFVQQSVRDNYAQAEAEMEG